MHIVIAPDSFKESLSAPAVARAIRTGFEKVFPEASFDELPLGDGGEGTLAILADALGLQMDKWSVTGPLGLPVQASFARKGELALFEMAEIVGLAMVPDSQRNPLLIQTTGVGEMILHLAQTGVRQMIIGVGGSASHDGGIGMAAALGYRFFDEEGRQLEAIGQNLGRIASLSDEAVAPELKQVTIQIVTDVSNPLCGKKGATYVFSAQKGLSPSEFERVDMEMKSFYQLVAPAILEQDGAGAGGGMAAGLLAFAGGAIVAGIDFVLDQVNFDERVSHADLVIVGEGRLDAQSLAGKTPIGVARRTPPNVPVIAICGSLKDDLPPLPFENICAAFPIISQVASLEDTLAKAEENLARTAEQVARVLQLGSSLALRESSQ